MDSRKLPGASPPLKREAEGSGEGSGTTSTQIADISNSSKRIRLEYAVCSIKKHLAEQGFIPSSERHAEVLRKFHAAVEEGNLTMVENLLEYGDEENALNILLSIDARSPLSTAVKNKQFPLAELLVTFKAVVNVLDEDGNPPLFYAIENVDVTMTELLLNNGAKVENFPDLLHLAASKKSVEIVEALLQQGADVNVRDEVGNSVLYSAVSTACEAILKSERAKKDITNTASIFNAFIDMFFLLLRFNADVNLANDEGSTPLHSSARIGNLQISTLLLNKRANINAEDERGNTPLHLAVIEGHADVVKLLLERGAKTDCCDNFDQSPLHLASSRGHARIVETLLDFGHCVDARRSLKRTPLHSAVMEDHEEVVKLLLKRGAQVNLADDCGCAPLYFAAVRGKAGIIDALLKSGAHLNAKSRYQETPLTIAVHYGQEEAVRLLLERGAELDSICPNGDTLLHSAATRGDSGIIEILLGFGACVNARSEDGRTALHAASEEWNASAVSTLLDNGADISMKCRRSYTPFDYARRFDRYVQSRGEYYRNIAVNRTRQRHGTMDLLFRHQVKLEAAGLNDTAPGSQREGGLDDFYFECQLEIARMKSLFIASTNVSCFDILKKGSKCVANFLKNKSIVLALESEDYMREFPIYAGIVGFKFREGLARTKLVERATHVFQRITDWPEDCTAKVLDFLDDDNLKVFLEV